MNYRPDIDGLRAVAVLAIIVYHANSKWLPGGIASLGIFFVISGYLITSIIHQEMGQGRFTFTQFYARRIKRILPLFYTVIFATAIACYFVLSPREFMEFGKTVRFAVVFLSNIYFAREQDYFAPSAEEVPLLHLWTLSVEEQYYLVWPALLLLFLRKVPRLAFPASLALGIASITLATFWAMDKATASLSYYSLPSRFGEFLIGSLLALYNPAINEKRAQVAAYSGLTLVISSLILVNDHVIYPGVNALWSCCGTALLIYSGSLGIRPWPNRLLAIKPMVFFGLISYSLYLWHWPFLAFSRYYTASSILPLPWVAFCLLSTVALSYLTWRFIEKPARFRKMSFKQSAIQYFLIPGISLLLLDGGLKISHGYLLRDRTEGPDTFDSPSLVCHNDFKQSCQRGDMNKPAETLVIGDSHGASMATFFDLLGQQQGWSADIMSVDSCPPLTNTDLSRITHHKQHTRCVKLVNYIKNDGDRYKNIIYSLRWELHLGYSHLPGYEPDPDFYSQLEQEIRLFTEQGKHVFLVSQPVLYTMNVERLFRTNGNDAPIDSTYLEANKRIRKLADSNPLVSFIDTASISRQWPNGVAEGIPCYKDNNHLNIHGQHVLVSTPHVFDWIGNIIRSDSN